MKTLLILIALMMISCNENENNYIPKKPFIITGKAQYKYYTHYAYIDYNNKVFVFEE